MGRNPYYDDSDEFTCDACGEVKSRVNDRPWGVNDTITDPKTGDVTKLELICDGCHRDLYRR